MEIFTHFWTTVHQGVYRLVKHHLFTFSTLQPMTTEATLFESFDRIMCISSVSSVTQSCLTLCDPMDCSHEIKRRLLLGGGVITNLDSIFKSRDTTLPTKVRLVKGMVFPLVMYGCESWTVKKAECRRIDAFELWYWRSLLRVPWTARRSNLAVHPKGIARTWKQPRCPSADEWIRKLWYIYTMEYSQFLIVQKFVLL